MNNLKENDNAMGDILTQAKTIAVVGHSDKPDRTSYQIAQFLRSVGYIVYPVNPLITVIDGQHCYADLREIAQPVDIVNIFRRAEYLPEIVTAAMAIHAKTLWTQLGIIDLASAQAASDAGMNVVMDACIRIEYLRLRSQ